MSYIVIRQRKNSRYVYEGTSFRNKDGKPRNHQCYLGRLDKDGVLITKKRKLPAKIKEVKTVTKRFILEAISGKLDMSRRNPSQSQSLESSCYQQESDSHALSAQSPSQHQEQIETSSPAEQGAHRTTLNYTEDQQISRQRSCCASPATRQLASPQDSALHFRKVCESPQHESSRSPRTHKSLLLASMLRVLHVQCRRKGQGIYTPQLFRRVC